MNASRNGTDIPNRWRTYYDLNCRQNAWFWPLFFCLVRFTFVAFEESCRTGDVRPVTVTNHKPMEWLLIKHIWYFQIRFLNRIRFSILHSKLDFLFSRRKKRLLGRVRWSVGMFTRKTLNLTIHRVKMPATERNQISNTQNTHDIIWVEIHMSRSINQFGWLWFLFLSC